MKFDIMRPDAATKSQEHREVYRGYEIMHTLVDFTAALLFLVGSVMFFYPSLKDLAIWAFILGSVFFALKPTVKLAREFHYLAIDRQRRRARGS